jgi:hypothetical protein
MTTLRINNIFRRSYVSQRANFPCDIATIVILNPTYPIYRGRQSVKRDEADDAETMFASSRSVMPIRSRRVKMHRSDPDAI